MKYFCSLEFFSFLSKVHEKTHSSERPYQCKECDKSFKTSRDMNRHTRKHTGVKPYKCTKCGKMFTQSGNLKRHVTNNKCKLQQNEVSESKFFVKSHLKFFSNCNGVFTLDGNETGTGTRNKWAMVNCVGTYTLHLNQDRERDQLSVIVRCLFLSPLNIRLYAQQ